ncbi:PR domain zinc finger protein 13 [Galleria mellonella]|uniref:PR domain zinc finger protein 13 n=1 Tax=Galleria mellonella TaxID=7137 RepID=A0ABM3MPQ4_GALME|nr:PR domain zinc finger protein 13 [Galleria mellonella]
MPVVAARGGLPRGTLSRAFSAIHLVQSAQTTFEDVMYIDVDESGLISIEGECAGGAAPAAAAAAAAAARLAPDVHARTAELAAADVRGDVALRLRLLADLQPHQELLLWFDDRVLALADMPFLALRNIKGKKNYECHECGAQFEQPNPLKVHLFLACGPYSPLAFWRQFGARLAAAAAGRASSFRPYAPVTPAAPLAPAAAAGAAEAAEAAARLEALAAEWGRARGGHVCVYCGKLYSRKYGLKIHIRTHTGYKPLRCRYCLRAFGDPSNLNKHVRLHAAGGDGAAGADGAGGGGAARLACGVCGKRLGRRRDLLRHVRARHSPCAVP